MRIKEDIVYKAPSFELSILIMLPLALKGNKHRSKYHSSSLLNYNEFIEDNNRLIYANRPFPQSLCNSRLNITPGFHNNT